jgi:hypothetical protein
VANPSPPAKEIMAARADSPPIFPMIANAITPVSARHANKNLGDLSVSIFNLPYIASLPNMVICQLI